MNDLYALLIKIDLLLNELVDILASEEKELSLFKVNAITLQSLADNKHRIITAINFHDKKRYLLEQERRLSPPYTGQAKLVECWSAITKKAKQANDSHERINYLIEQQMKKIKSIKEAMKELQKEHVIYEPGGDKNKISPAHFYHISV